MEVELDPQEVLKVPDKKYECKYNGTLRSGWSNLRSGRSNQILNPQIWTTQLTYSEFLLCLYIQQFQSTRTSTSADYIRGESLWRNASSSAALPCSAT